MNTNTHFDKSIMAGLKDYFADDIKFCEVANRESIFKFKSFKIVGYDVREVRNFHNTYYDIDQTTIVYDLLITYKAKKFEDNCCAFEMDVTGANIEFKYNGHAYMVEKDGKVMLNNSSVSYGSFTEEKATAWLKKMADRINKIAAKEGQ